MGYWAGNVAKKPGGLVGASVEAWSRGDREAYLGDVHPGLEFHTSGVFPGLKPIYRGPDGAAGLWEARQGPWKTSTVTLERVEDLGDRVVGWVHFSVRGREGIPMRTDNFPIRAAALEAVRPRE